MSTNTPAEIRRLVARFEEQRDSYLHASYKEAQLRKEFIDPMWKALGWDMDNSQGHAEQYKEVIHEDAIKLSSSVYSKAPDYCFRIGGVRKFFLEAKKPAVESFRRLRRVSSGSSRSRTSESSTLRHFILLRSSCLR